MKKLENKVAVITGGNSGIGLQTAILFAENGAKIGVMGRDQKTVDAALMLIGGEAIGTTGDVSKIDSTLPLYNQVINKFGNIDILVVNAGIYSGGKMSEVTEEQFDEISDVNFKGVFFSIQKALPFLNDGSSIIITSTAMSTMGLSGVAAYSASKAAAHSLARSFSAELADRKIRVNVLSPGPIDTPIIGRGGISSEQIEKMKIGRAGRTVANRLGTSDEIAAGMLYLASEDSRFMLGGEIVLDGGMRIK